MATSNSRVAVLLLICCAVVVMLLVQQPTTTTSSTSTISSLQQQHRRRHPPVVAATTHDALAAAAAATAATDAALYAECPGVPPGWLPECWVAAHARISFGGDRYLEWVPFTSRRWGNVLSSYWMARALALLAGQGFNAFVGFEAGWLRHLPKRVPPTTCPQLDAFQAACSQCDSESWEYAHRCAGAWTAIRPTIINDTQAAFAAWAAQRGAQLPAFGRDDVVIQSRCSNDTLLAHPEYGPVAFSYYANIPASSHAARITIVTDLRSRAPLCRRIHGAQLAWLRAAFPAANVSLQGGAGMHADFAQLLLAPLLFRDSQSSFGLWAALANRGRVWSVPLLQRFTNNTRPDLGPGWQWADAPVLYPHVAQAAGISLEQPEAIVGWLETH